MSESELEDWDVDFYKIDHEPKEHWELRRKFILAYKSLIPQDQLICLSNVLINIEYLGCRYSSELMLKISLLAEGIIAKFKRKHKLKRVFVSSTYAASLRIQQETEKRNQSVPFKDENQTEKIETKETNQNPTSFTSIYLKPITFVPACNVDKEEQIKSLKPVGFVQAQNSSPQERSNEEINNTSSQNILDDNNITSIKSLEITNAPFSDFVLFLNASAEETPISIIRGSATLNNKKIIWRSRKTENLKERKWSLFLGKELLASEIGADAKFAMASAAQTALERLKKCCYIVKVKSKVYSEINIDRSTFGRAHQSKLEAKCSRQKESKNQKLNIKGSDSNDPFTVGELFYRQSTLKTDTPPEKESENKKSNLEKKIASKSIGLRIMKLMGWEGGGLGINEQGIEEPIKPSVQFSRKGLGLESEKKTGEKPKLNKKEMKLKENTKTTKNQKENKIKSTLTDGGSENNILAVKTLTYSLPKKNLEQVNKVDYNSFRKNLKDYLKKWMESSSSQDLVFSPEFSKVERKAMHKIANELSLKSKSYGEDNDRHLVVSRKFSPWEIIEELAATGGSSDKYELV